MKLNHFGKELIKAVKEYVSTDFMSVGERIRPSESRADYVSAIINAVAGSTVARSEGTKVLVKEDFLVSTTAAVAHAHVAQLIRVDAAMAFAMAVNLALAKGSRTSGGNSLVPKVIYDTCEEWGVGVHDVVEAGHLYGLSEAQIKQAWAACLVAY